MLDLHELKRSHISRQKFRMQLRAVKKYMRYLLLKTRTMYCPHTQASIFSLNQFICITNLCSWRKCFQNSALALEQGQPAPSAETLIGFADYVATTGKGHVTKQMSVRSCVSIIERFFAGFKRMTRVDIELSVKKGSLL